MIKMTLEVPEAQFQALRDSLKSKFVRPALAAAINAELGKMKTQCKREAAKILNVPQEKEIAPRLSVRDATEATLSGSVIVKRLPIPLSRFKPRQTSTGITVTVRKTGGSESIPHAFLAAVGTGNKHAGVFVREGQKVAPTKGIYAGKTVRRGVRRGQFVLRQPIRELFGPTVVTVLQGAAAARIETAAQADLPAQIESQIARFQAGANIKS